jgi:tight adherence protein C
MQIILAGIIALVTIVSGVLLFVVSLRWIRADEISFRVKEFVAEGTMQGQAPPEDISTRRFDIVGPFTERTILPAFRRLGGFLSRMTPGSILTDIDSQLMIANNPLGMGSTEFLGVQILFFVLSVIVTVLIIRRTDDFIFTLLALLLLVILILLPTIWLRSQVRKRQSSILKGLPDAIDMLSVCATAGLGFDQSLQRVSDEWNTPIGVELGRVVSEMEMGLSRSEALRNLGERFDIPALSSFVAILIQSDALGMSIAETLHAQAAQMREERRFRAQEEARKIPTKMLFPLAFLIFPAIIAVILGPAIPQLMSFFTTL